MEDALQTDLSIFHGRKVHQNGFVMQWLKKCNHITKRRKHIVLSVPQGQRNCLKHLLNNMDRFVKRIGILFKPVSEIFSQARSSFRPG